MYRNLFTLVLASSLFCLTGCAKKASREVSSHPAAYMQFAAMAAPAAMKTYIAESHIFEIVTPESELQKSWESTVNFCATLHCEVLTSNITNRSEDSAASGAISLRVTPEDLTKLLTYVEKLGKVAQHTTERQDKTVDVADTDARIKNLTSFRDNLRAMLSKPSATVKDLVEIQQQLTDTQSQLDSEMAQRTILANQTEKIAVSLTFRVARPSTRAGGFAPIRNALRESGSVLAESTAYLIEFIFSVIPWLVLAVPGVWLVVKGWRRYRPKQTVRSAQSDQAI